MLKYVVLNNSMVLNHKDKTYVITRDDPNYDKLLKAISDNTLDEIPGILGLEAYRERGFDIGNSDNMVYLNGVPLDVILNPPQPLHCNVHTNCDGTGKSCCPF